jgi:hypothetical protein
MKHPAVLTVLINSSLQNTLSKYFTIYGKLKQFFEVGSCPKALGVVIFFITTSNALLQNIFLITKSFLLSLIARRLTVHRCEKAY